MSNQFVGEIGQFCFDFNPVGWAFCNGALLPISQNTALFSLLGTFYGGDGKTTFALPNLSARVACGGGQGQGLSERFIGEMTGSATVSLLESEIPNHNHNMSVYSQTAPGSGTGTPVNGGGQSFLVANTAAKTFTSIVPGATSLSRASTRPSGTSQPHENRQPYLAINFCIALQGVFPPRS